MTQALAFVRCIETAMSKVYSFRLDENNPREAQAKEVIEVWISKGYFLRHIVVDALISYRKAKLGQAELNFAIEQLQNLILTLEKEPATSSLAPPLPIPFLDAVKQSMKSGVSDK